jgi:hypothetical protein
MQKAIGENLITGEEQMKITKRQLRRIIKESKSRILSEQRSQEANRFEEIMGEMAELVEEAFDIAGGGEEARRYWHNTILANIDPRQYGMMSSSLSMADTLEELGGEAEEDMMEAGYNDGTSGSAPRYPDNQYYMVNYNDGKKEAEGY